MIQSGIRTIVLLYVFSRPASPSLFGDYPRLCCAHVASTVMIRSWIDVHFPLQSARTYARIRFVNVEYGFQPSHTIIPLNLLVRISIRTFVPRLFRITTKVAIGVVNTHIQYFYNHAARTQDLRNWSERGPPIRGPASSKSQYFSQKATRNNVAIGPKSSEMRNQLRPLRFFPWAIPALINARLPHPIA